MAEEVGRRRDRDRVGWGHLAAGAAELGVTELGAEGDAIARYRPLLFSIAYRMTGSALDAEDLVQEAFLRWQGADRAAVTDHKAYLTTVVTRLAIDHLRAARARREEYVGPWLPEPIATDGDGAVAGLDDQAALAESLSLAFLVLLESLTPVERAVFLLHDVFAYPFDEVARIVDKSAATCRQIAGRARRHVRERRPRFAPSPAEHADLTRRFVRACTDGDLDGLLTLLADDATAWADGGGKAPTAPADPWGDERRALPAGRGSEGAGGCRGARARDQWPARPGRRGRRRHRGGHRAGGRGRARRGDPPRRQSRQAAGAGDDAGLTGQFIPSQRASA